MENKIFVLMIVFIVMGLFFIATGIVFITGKYMNKLLESCESEEKRNNAKKMAKTCSLVSLVLGLWTFFTGFIVVIMPAAFNILSLIYLFVLIIAVSVIGLVLKTNNLDSKK